MKDKHKKMYMKMAYCLAEASKDKRLKVGSIIVGKGGNIIASGYNGMPEHISEPNQLPDGTTDARVRHAEKNALMALTRCNESSVDSTMFVTHSCCKYCAIDVVDAGVKKVIYDNEYRCSEGIQYLKDNGVEVEKL